MITDHGSSVSRRKLGIFGFVAGIAGVMAVVTGIRAREDSCTKLREWTDNQAISTVAVVLPTPRLSRPPSICRAGWRPIIARRSLHASAAI
jgi:membrane fusion protein (multidrug efflux system)